MKRLFIVIALALGLFIACDKSDNSEEIISGEIKDNSSQQEDLIFLSDLFIEISTISSSVVCTDGQDWKYTPYGHKACGGPLGYIAYHEKINESSFLSKVKFYSHQQEIYNEKWELSSDCTVPPEPSAINCIEGTPVFIY